MDFEPALQARTETLASGAKNAAMSTFDAGLTYSPAEKFRSSCGDDDDPGHSSRASFIAMVAREKTDSMASLKEKCAAPPIACV